MYSSKCPELDNYSSKNRVKIYVLSEAGMKLKEAIAYITENDVDVIENKCKSIRDDYTMASFASEVVSQYQEELAIDPYNTVLEILEYLHERWIGFDGLYFERNDNQDYKKDLVRRLPMQVCGLENAAVVMPFIEKLGVKVGEMVDGHYEFDEKMKDLFNSYSSKYLKENCICSKADLKAKLPFVIATYKPFTKEWEAKRVSYMLKHRKEVIEQLENSPYSVLKKEVARTR